MPSRQDLIGILQQAAFQNQLGLKYEENSNPTLVYDRTNDVQQGLEVELQNIEESDLKVSDDHTYTKVSRNSEGKASMSTQLPKTCKGGLTLL